MELAEIFAELETATAKLRAAEGNRDWFAARRATNDLTVLLNKVQAAAGIKVTTLSDLMADAQ